ncbi:MAG: HEAT repeat domain-containing protein, partial [Planctomycetota bacterium]|nr:HEAT repeat domain-containing protein [Planctomycetota bacterium]
TLLSAKDPAAIQPLAKVLPTLNVPTQYLAMQVLQVYPDKQAEATLRALLTSDAPFVRMAAAEILYRRGDERAARVVAKALLDPAATIEIKKQMMTRLSYGRAPADKAVAAAIRAHLDPAHHPTVICGALRVIAGQADPDATPAVEKLVADARPGVRAVALAFLYGAGDDARAGPLAELFGTGDVPYHELWTADVLLRDRKGVAAAIPGALVKLLTTTKDVQYLRGLIGILERMRHRAAVPELRKLIEHKDTSVSQLAARAVATLTGAAVPTPTGAGGLESNDTVALAKLIKTRDTAKLAAWLADKNPARRLMAADALRRMDDPSGLPAVIAEMRDEVSTQHYLAVLILGKFVDRRAVPPLLDTLAHPEARVRRRARYGLQKLLQRLFPYRRLELGLTGYTAYGDDDKRAAAIETIRAWWQANKDAGW